MNVYVNFSCCVILSIFGIIYQGNAQDIKVEAKLDKSKIALGDQTVLRISATLPVAEQINFPNLTDTISSKIQIVAIDGTDTIKDKENPKLRTITRSYTITSFDAGMQVIPSFSFQYNSDEIKTIALPLEVVSVAVDTTKAIFDIKQPIAVSYTFVDWLRDNWHWVVFAIVCLIMLAAIIYYFKKMRKTKPVDQPEKQVIPPHLVALEKLQEIKSKKMWQQGAVKQYYSELSDVVREYLENRYDIHAMEQTSDEILSSLGHLKLRDEDTNMLKQLLLLADLVKFAKANPLSMENELSIDNAVTFISQTKMQDQLPGNKTERNEIV